MSMVMDRQQVRTAPRRNCRIMVTASTSEQDAIRERARAAQMTVSEYMRRQALQETQHA
jgi:hypothetical protein